MNQVFSFMNTKTYLHTENAAFYLVGYGDAANAAAALAVAYQSIWCGIGIFGVDNFDISFLTVGDNEAPSRAASTIPYTGVALKDTPAPVWIGAASKTSAVATLMDYWKHSNNAYTKASSNSYANEVWQPAHYLDTSWNINDVEVSRVLLTLGDMDYIAYKDGFTNYLWYNFLETQRREDAFKIEAFRPFKHVDDYMDHYTISAYDNVSSSSLREYWVYEPVSAKAKATGTVPMVVVMHGANQSGADMPHFSGWDQVAEANGIIVVFPTGARGTGYKATCSPNVANDIDFFEKMVAKVKADYPRIDTTRLYLSGHSMGCNFTVQISIIRPDFAAVASASYQPPYNVTGTAANGTALGPQINKSVPMPIMISVGEFDTAIGALGSKTVIHAGTYNNFNNATAGASWFARNGVTDTTADAAKAYHTIGSLSGWTFKNANENVPVVKFQWVSPRVHAVLPEEAFSLYDFLKHYSRGTDGKSYYDGTEITL
ncbi:hypothetical protein AGMMS50293_09660 [Spirochaetia bacterium]|nr:hypothetical protein AGMMS50293_09660 [Spirochaetia bacterium]